MSGCSSDSESSHSSQCDSEYNYIPGYVIQDESNNTSHEIGTIETVDREILGDYDACLYADEPPVDEEWYAQYLKKSAEHSEQKQMLQQRLDGLEDIKSWCKCGYCVITHLQNTHEAWCCQEIEACREVLNDNLVLEDVLQPPRCITLHPGFRPICLEKWALRNLARKYKTHDQRRYRQTGSEQTFLRSISYREFIFMVHGYLGDQRRPLPACAYNAIRSTFNDGKEQFKGFEDET